jgi:DNA invertase Pin-like site-specific DNA recombinase
MHRAPLTSAFGLFTPVKLRAGIYTRKTTKLEGGATKSLDEQLRHCQMVCEHYGLEMSDDRIYSEPLGQKGEWYWNDGTGRFPEPYRPELTRLMADIEAGLVDVLVIWRSDRLFRDSGVCDALARVFAARGTRLICGVREIDATSSSGLYQLSTEAANNRRWRDQTSEDIKRDHDFKFELGMFTRNPTALGFRSKGKESQDVTTVPEELALVNRVFNLFVFGEGDEGPMGTTGIASYLMDQCIRWPKGYKNQKVKSPATIHESQIRTVLSNPMYVGRWRHNGQERDCAKLLAPVLDADGKPTGEKTTAVPVALFELAQEKLARSDRPGKRSLGGAHLTTGIAVCARCGRPLEVHSSHGKYEKGPKRGQPKEPTKKFKCSHKRGERPCRSSSAFGLQEHVLDDWIMQELAPVLSAEMQAIRSSAARDKDTEDLARLRRLLAETRKSEARKLALAIDALDAEQFAAVAAQLRANRELLERNAKAIGDRLRRSESMMPDLDPDNLAARPTAAVKDALSQAVAWIAIGPAGTGIVVHTRWGSYIGARYRKGDRNADEPVSKTFLAPPTPTDALTCLDWIAHPEEFVRGRRDSLGKAGESLTDAEILPGLIDPDGKYDPAIALEVEVEEAA